jgi:hypothetical protein
LVRILAHFHWRRKIGSHTHSQGEQIMKEQVSPTVLISIAVATALAVCILAYWLFWSPNSATINTNTINERIAKKGGH